ncbi:hypothetical protein [Maritimibacter sp. HL-12]|jgi:hypothetical protein|nr:hypothetical protein [Maritimibacter sp. HL-12]SMH32533.1 hypothetical protein SAMN05661107_0348 [Maritimibacter sp. HL-12]
MPFFANLTVDQVIIAFLAVVALREVMFMLLPERAFGPLGWLLPGDDDT